MYFVLYNAAFYAQQLITIVTARKIKSVSWVNLFLEIKDTNLSFSDCYSSSDGGTEQETISEADTSKPSAMKISGNTKEFCLLVYDAVMFQMTM